MGYTYNIEYYLNKLGLLIYKYEGLLPLFSTGHTSINNGVGLDHKVGLPAAYTGGARHLARDDCGCTLCR